MSIAILSSHRTSPYDVGAAELRKARNAMKQLKELKVSKDTYKRAQNSKSAWNWNWITGDDGQKKKIDKQTKLENEISKELYSIAAANARNPKAVSPEVMKEARSIDKQLDKRFATDYDNALGGVGELGSYADKALGKLDDHHALEVALNGGKPDAIPLDSTQSFISQFRKNEAKLKAAVDALASPGSLSKSELEKNMKDQDSAGKAIKKEWNLMDAQVGSPLGFEPGISISKVLSLPDGDPLKKPYEAQNNALQKLQHEAIFRPEIIDLNLT